MNGKGKYERRKPGMPTENTLSIHTSLADIKLTNKRELFSIANHLTITVYNKDKVVLFVGRGTILSSTPMKIELNEQEFDTRPEIVKMLATADSMNKDKLYVDLTNDFKFYNIKRKEYGIEYNAPYYARTITLNTKRIHDLGYQVNYNIDFGYTPKLIGTKEFYKKHKMFNMSTHAVNKSTAEQCNDYDILLTKLELNNSKYKMVFKVKLDDLRDLYFCTRAKHLDEPNPIQTISLKEYYGNMRCGGYSYFDTVQCENCNILTFITGIDNSVTNPNTECYVVFFFKDSISLIGSVSEDASMLKILHRMSNEQGY